MHPQTIAEPIKWLGETIGFWVQTVAFTISAFAAVGIIYSSKRQEKKRATIDLILNQRSDSEYIQCRHTMMLLHERNETNLAKYHEDLESSEYKGMLGLLNVHEFVAAGIRRGAFDEETLKRMRYSTLLKDWDALSGFVVEFRRIRKIPTLFQEFEWLAERWKTKRLKADKPLNH